MTKKRLPPNDRKYEILMAAIAVAGRPGGWSKLTRDAVAREAKCADGLVSKYFNTMGQMRRAVMRFAVLTENLHVIAQGLATGDENAMKAAPELKARALNTLVG